MHPRTLLIIGAAVVVGVGIYLISDRPFPASISQPSATSTPSSTTTTVGIGETATGIFGASVTPLGVVEDSRCAAEVTCIWAGTVRVRARLVDGMGTSTTTFSLGETVTGEVVAITLRDVHPGTHAGSKILSEQYRLTFVFEKRI